MKRKEAMDHLENTYVKEIISKNLANLKMYADSHKKELLLDITDSFCEMCYQLSQKQSEYNHPQIGYLIYSFRRTYLLKRNYSYSFEAYDKNWFFDTTPYRTLYNASWAFQYWENAWDELEIVRKRYMNLIHPPDVEWFILRAADAFHQVIAELVEEAVIQMLDMEPFSQIQKEAAFEIRIGEYKGISKVIYQTDPIRSKEIEYL
ncbi:hypothetical protein [Paenibacillus bovis]|uniref:Uncharacterized protein n=1 Tax=Paenibacillus bovis TaxID=1616788 RepID=A0A172ZCM5_9BACL|nr:hypothetical protein [Paenibacillus bovis]ANF94910.1 hypothetical protein AR543_01925 [Paenibacillus bovis]